MTAMGDNALNENMVLDPRIENWVTETLTVGNLEQYTKKIEELKKMGELGYIIKQLIYFSVKTSNLKQDNQLSQVDTEKRLVTAHSIICQLLGLSRENPKPSAEFTDIVIRNVAPLLDTEDKYLKEHTGNVLLIIDDKGGLRKADYSSYIPYLKENKNTPPLGLIRYMYEKAPGDAINALAQAYIEDPVQIQRIFSDEKIVSLDIRNRRYKPREVRPEIGTDAIRILTDFSKDSRWWVRLYVAEIMSFDRDIRDSLDSVREQLKTDEHPLIVNVFVRLEKKIFN